MFDRSNQNKYTVDNNFFAKNKTLPIYNLFFKSQNILDTTHEKLF